MPWALQSVDGDLVYLHEGSKGRRDLVYFLSLFDAMLLAVYLVDQGISLAVLFSDEGITDCESALTPSMHIAWKALNGRLVLNASGLPDALFRPTGPLSYDKFHLRPDEAAMKLFEHVRELAGLYAWRETIISFNASSAYESYERVRTAWRKVPTCRKDENDTFDQFAILDPESGEWHFVSLSWLASSFKIIKKGPDKPGATE